MSEYLEIYSRPIETNFQIIMSGDYSAFSEEKMKFPAIYMASGIQKTENGHNTIYIGSCKDLRERVWLRHRNQLKTQSHYNPPMQNYYNKYGSDVFVWFLLEKPQEGNLEIKTREQCYLDSFRPFIDEGGGFNIVKDVFYGFPPESITNKLGESIYSKDYCFVSPELDIHKGINIKRFAIKNNLCPASMAALQRGDGNHYKGWIRCPNEFNSFLRLDEINYSRVKGGYWWVSEANKKMIYNFFLDGYTQKEISQNLEISLDKIFSVIRNRPECLERLNGSRALNAEEQKYAIASYKNNISATKIGEILKTSHTSVLRVLEKIGIKQKKSYPQTNKNSLANLGKLTEDQKKYRDEKTSEKTARSFKIRSPEGTIIEGFNMNKFCREKNLSPSCMNQVLHGKIKNHKGWTKP